MNLYAARNLARSLMAQHGVGDWTFAFDHARRRFGSCQPRRKRITLSRMLTLLNDEPEVRDTILHEIAHALTPDDHHGPRWKAACAQLGAKPVRCYTDDSVISPARRIARYRIGCPKCGWWHDRHRRTRRRLICRTCRAVVVIEVKST